MLWDYSYLIWGSICDALGIGTVLAHRRTHTLHALLSLQVPAEDFLFNIYLQRKYFIWACPTSLNVSFSSKYLVFQKILPKWTINLRKVWQLYRMGRKFSQLSSICYSFFPDYLPDKQRFFRDPRKETSLKNKTFKHFFH